MVLALLSSSLSWVWALGQILLILPNKSVYQDMSNSFPGDRALGFGGVVLQGLLMETGALQAQIMYPRSSGDHK